MLINRIITADETQIAGIIAYSMGNPSPDKIQEVIKSYSRADSEIIATFDGELLVGIVGLHKTNHIITIRHISVLPSYQRKRIGTSLLDDIKKRYLAHKIIAETDEEAVEFYTKLGFVCRAFQSKYKNLRYHCQFN